jgi:dienelactone hydrolase
VIERTCSNLAALLLHCAWVDMRIVQSTAACFDVAVVRFFERIAQPPLRRRVSHDERLAQLEHTARVYGSVRPDEFFPAPPIPRMSERRVRAVPGGEVVDVAWDSGWVPFDAATRDAYLRFGENRIARARLLRHDRPSPAIVCLHGYRAGVHRFEEMAWRAGHLYSRLGLDVALLTLPFHALRAPRGRLAPVFPSMRAGRTIEGFGQSVWDTRALLSWMRSRGSSRAGVAGMSLGGYTAALLATVEAQLDWAVLFIPLADLTDVVFEHAALRGRPLPERLREPGKQALHLVRPLARAPVIPGDRMLVVAAQADRITQIAHAERLAAHFGAPLVTFPGGHLLQFGRWRGISAMEKLIRARLAEPAGR